MKTLQEIARERAEIMLAFADGAEIEYMVLCESMNWVANGKPQFDWARCDYRVKPKPVVPRRAVCTHDKSKEEGDRWFYSYSVKDRTATINNLVELVEMIELTPEVAAAVLAAGITFEDADKWKEGQQ